MASTDCAVGEGADQDKGYLYGGHAGRCQAGETCHRRVQCGEERGPGLPRSPLLRRQRSVLTIRPRQSRSCGSRLDRRPAQAVDEARTPVKTDRGTPPRLCGRWHGGPAAPSGRRSGPAARAARSATTARSPRVLPACAGSWRGCRPERAVGAGPRLPRSTCMRAASTSARTCPPSCAARRRRAGCGRPAP